MLTPRNLEIANELMAWARGYLMAKHDQMKRPSGSQVVCPFVRASVNNNSLFLEFYDEVAEAKPDWIEQIVLASVPRFLRLSPHGDNDRSTKALLMVFPNLSEDQAPALDAVHASVKTEFVEHGLMIGQFHPRCEERCIYNPAFKVSVSKYPLMAVRHMALHDILFLGSDAHWFYNYDLRFGHRFARPETIENHNQHLLRYYEEARRRFARGELAGRPKETELRRYPALQTP